MGLNLFAWTGTVGQFAPTMDPLSIVKVCSLPPDHFLVPDPLKDLGPVISTLKLPVPWSPVYQVSRKVHVPLTSMVGSEA